MATYVWDLGFDFNALSTPDNHNLPYIPNNLALMGGVCSIGNPLNLDLEDTISFRVFNITANSTVAGYSILSGLFSFFTTEEDKTPYPFDPFAPISVGDSASPITVFPEIGDDKSTINIPEIHLATQQGESPIFPWRPTFPRWEIISSPLRITTKGAYVFTVSLEVQGPSGSSRTFLVDPEMIIGGVG